MGRERGKRRGDDASIMGGGSVAGSRNAYRATARTGGAPEALRLLAPIMRSDPGGGAPPSHGVIPTAQDCAAGPRPATVDRAIA